ncbi:hypothetical protein B6I21_09475 [candidate division KSB1 bacterium 4572_119]|nr:MAG: hypothetical protein B6I21_09475 [candidate division KSB1 bacterium 4572_119]
MHMKEKETDKLAILAQFSEELTGIENNDKLFDFLIDGISKIIGCSQASLMMFDSEKRILELMKVRGYDAKGIGDPRIELTHDISKWVYDGGEVFALTEDGSTKYLILFDQQENKYFDCELRIPLLAKNHKITLLNIGKKATGTDYSNEDITVLQILVNLVRLAIERSIGLQESANGIARSKKDKKGDISPKNIQIKKKVEGVNIIGVSPAIEQVHNFIERVANKDVSVLITGESGTGKDLVARSIHQKSDRQDKPYVAMNCAALPENLVESELFGHEKGAFTGAHMQKKGKFEYADGGTLFLDEIGDMNLTTQAKLLRVLEDGSFQRTGGNSTLKSDVRILAASNKNINEEITNGNFREDLYYRINVVQIHIPPLRERKEDIEVLAEYFFEKFNSFYDKKISKIDNSAKTRLMEYEFPGNIRELQNIIERAVIMEQSCKLTIDFMPSSDRKKEMGFSINSEGSLVDLEKEHIKKVLEDVNFNKSHAATS